MMTCPHLRTLAPTRSRNLGVTLIEILLVISVLSLITMLGVRTIQQQTLQTKIAITGEQLQGLATAANAYYESVQSHWPEKLTDLTSFFPPSLLAKPLTNPWGLALSLPDDPKTLPYYVATIVPDESIARRLQFQLPLSTYLPLPQANNTTQYEVRMYLTTPSALSWQGVNLGAKIQGIQLIYMTSQNDYTVPDFTCPTHSLPNWAAGMASFGKDFSEGNGEFISGVTLCTANSDATICPGTKKPVMNNQIRLRMTRWTGEYQAHANVLLIQYCEPMS